MSFLDGKPRVATEQDCQTRWHGMPLGEGFRCNLCGHRFKVGDIFRFVFTNDTPGAGGNPLVCEKCDGPDVKERWAAMVAEARERFWFFTREHFCPSYFDPNA